MTTTPAAEFNALDFKTRFTAWVYGIAVVAGVFVWAWNALTSGRLNEPVLDSLLFAAVSAIGVNAASRFGAITHSPEVIRAKNEGATAATAAVQVNAGDGATISAIPQSPAPPHPPRATDRVEAARGRSSAAMHDESDDPGLG